MEIDITFFRKKDDDDDGVNAHMNIPIYRNKDLIQGALHDVLHWLSQVEWNFQQLAQTSKDQPFMYAFPRNECGCTSFYRLCPYYNICHSWNNPTAYADKPPFGFVVSHWDPRSVQTEDSRIYHFEGTKGE
jgi:hypothetical protein